MAVALEELTPEAAGAVSAARAGKGARLSPAVRDELIAKGARKAKAAPPPEQNSTPAPSGGGGGGGGGGRSLSLPSGRGLSPTRMILAFGAFLLALELGSYLSGRYFSYSLKAGGQKLQTAAQHVDLYPGQSQKLALQKVLPISNAVPGYAGTQRIG